MSKSLLRTDKEIKEIYERHRQTVYRVCFAYMKNSEDAADAVQETFIRLIRKAPAFENTEHEKAWIIRTASNICKDELKHWWRKHDDLDNYKETESTEKTEIDDVIMAVMDLPDKYKTVVYLYYYEGYTSVEIADILGKPKSTIRNYLHEARKILKERLGDIINEE